MAGHSSAPLLGHASPAYLLCLTRFFPFFFPIRFLREFSFPNAFLPCSVSGSFQFALSEAHNTTIFPLCWLVTSIYVVSVGDGVRVWPICSSGFFFIYATITFSSVLVESPDSISVLPRPSVLSSGRWFRGTSRAAILFFSDPLLQGR